MTLNTEYVIYRAIHEGVSNGLATLTQNKVEPGEVVNFVAAHVMEQLSFVIRLNPENLGIIEPEETQTTVTPPIT